MIRPSARRSDDLDGSASGPGTKRDVRVEIEEFGDGFLLRPSGERPYGQAELVAALTPDEDLTIVVVAVPDELADALWPRLAELFSRLEPRRILLAMSGAGAGRTDRPALAKRIAEAWEATVIAPAGDVVLVPGGTLFTCAAGPEDPDPQWWSFAPDGEAEALGPRWPVPEWHTALPPAEAGARTLLAPVPAGAHVRPAGADAPAPGDLTYAIPAVPDGPSVLVGVPGGPQVTADELVEALAGPVADPAWRRRPLRLVPSGGTDLLPLGQAVARELALDVEVLTGLPVDLAYRDGAPEPGDLPAGHATVLADDEGRPTWSPFVASVVCGPPGSDGVAPRPRPVSWRPPVTGMTVADASRGILRLDDTWRVTVTRAGLWLHPADAGPDADRFIDAWPPSADSVRLDIGITDGPLDDRVWPLLDGLLGAMPDRLRGRLRLVTHGTVTEEGDLSIRRLASEHGVTREGSALPPVRTSTAAPVTPAPAAAPARSRAVRSGSIAPTHRSTEEEQTAFRALIGLRWDTHAAPVRRAFSRLPAVGAGERAAASVDLVAVRLFLTEPDGDYGPAALRSGDERLRPYLACLASGLRRLPTYRGAVVRGVDGSAIDRLGLRSGASVLTGSAPVGGLSLAGRSDPERDWPPTTAAYVIWSDTARWVAALLDGAEDAPPDTGGDVVFGPGTRFAVLDVRRGDADTPDLTLLRELPAPLGGESPPGGRLALSRLDEVLEATRLGPAGTRATPWPAHCLGPIGASAPPASTAGSTAGA